MRDAKLHKDIDYICKSCKKNLCASTKDDYVTDYMNILRKVIKGY